MRPGKQPSEGNGDEEKAAEVTTPGEEGASPDLGRTRPIQAAGCPGRTRRARSGVADLLSSGGELGSGAEMLYTLRDRRGAGRQQSSERIVEITIGTRNAITLSGVTRRPTAVEWRNVDRRVTSDRDV